MGMKGLTSLYNDGDFAYDFAQIQTILREFVNQAES